MLDLFAWGIVIYIGYVLFSIFRNTVKTESAKYKRKRSNQDKIEKFTNINIPEVNIEIKKTTF